MKLGFFTMPIHPLNKDWRQSLREDREAFLLADELGFNEAYVGEHVTDQAENITSCVAFLAWIAAATKQIKLGTGTVNMPNVHPATVAATVAMLDHMLDGRLIFGISPGGLLSDAELFGTLERDRNAMFLEAINQVLEIWANEPPYNLQGKYWNVSVEKTLIADIGQGFIDFAKQLLSLLNLAFDAQLGIQDCYGCPILRSSSPDNLDQDLIPDMKTVIC